VNRLGGKFSQASIKIESYLNWLRRGEAKFVRESITCGGRSTS
jgi:hypothetical protein